MHKAVESISYKTMLKHYYTTTFKIYFSDWTKSKGTTGELTNGLSHDRMSIVKRELH